MDFCCFYCSFTRVWFCHFSSALGIETVVCPRDQMDLTDEDFCGVLIQYPDTEGTVYDMSELVKKAHAHGVSRGFLKSFPYVQCSDTVSIFQNKLQ